MRDHISQWAIIFTFSRCCFFVGERLIEQWTPISKSRSWFQHYNFPQFAQRNMILLFLVLFVIQFLLKFGLCIFFAKDVHLFCKQFAKLFVPEFGLIHFYLPKQWQLCLANSSAKTRHSRKSLDPIFSTSLLYFIKSAPIQNLELID